MEVKSLISKNTIVLHPSEGQPINISKETDRLLFEEVSEIIEEGNQEELLDKYLDIKGKIERYSNKIFTIDNERGEMYLKGDSTPMPELMVKKLFELEKAGEDFMPLIRFWKKLKKNPSQRSIEQLYDFMVHNGIGLTESGDIVVEKGVNIKDGKLVDKYTGTIDNSIGQTVEMPREKVNDDPNQTCSYGLHVGAPEYVRQYYSGTIVKCTVNPMDVVSVPVDYNNTKMRVCKYVVVGYSDEHSDHKPIFKLSDFVTVPNEYTQTQLEETKPRLATVEEAEGHSISDESEPTENIEVINTEEVKIDENLITKVNEMYIKQAEEELEGLTANQILDYIEDTTGVRMPYSPKSKRTILKRGIEILSNHKETEDNE